MALPKCYLIPEAFPDSLWPNQAPLSLSPTPALFFSNLLLRKFTNMQENIKNFTVNTYVSITKF